MTESQAPEQFELTEQRVTAFIPAAQGINGVVETVGPQIEAAETDEAHRQLQMHAQGQMADIVTEAGLSVDEYKAIANAARGNENVANHIRSTAEAMTNQQ